MRLKKLELVGFKSFAHKTALEFPFTISAIIGPNGSGKSNLVDALRWVLGEQSMKNLRSKSGADLIWAGSPKKPSVGKAGVNLHFDNKDGFFPIDFEEVVIGRKVYKDGTSEYYLNDSQVRLKDIAELLARSKLGLRGHSIVNQGSADEILKASPSERRGILEEALGLREFQLKKTEAETKLIETNQNLEQTANLINEISPHLRSLRRQVDKFKKREFLINDLNNLETDYFKIKVAGIIKERAANSKAKEELSAKAAAAHKDYEGKENLFKSHIGEALKSGERTKEVEENLSRLNLKRQDVMRELGRLEGLIESHKKTSAKNVKTVEAVLALKIKYWGKKLDAILELGDLAPAKEAISALAGEIREISNHFEKGETGKILEMANLADVVSEQSPYEKEKEELKAKFANLEEEMAQAKDALNKIRTEEGSFRENYLNMQRDLEIVRRQYVAAQEAAQKFELEEEKINLREEDVKSEMWGAGKNYNEFFKTHFEKENKPQIVLANLIFGGGTAINAAELENKIIKLRREISDIGTVDDETIREYEETNKRHEFLAKETDDLEKAILSLKGLISDLAGKIDNDFKIGLAKINEEFNHYFRLMFNGGSARLSSEVLDEGEAGVAVGINVPGKRISDLNVLSGGEKALASIALLFAIVAASRPPFLILDEVDAALDENNAVRFAKVLKDLAQKTQFILITHNRATMEAAEVLYGVTMGDDGVSKLFSLKLTDPVPH